MSLSNVLVLGGGSAGLIAAITIKRVIPGLDVRVIRSPEIGVIGVGEGTTPYFPVHLHQFLRLSPKDFMERAQPIWKLGVRFLWGPRQEFNFSFDRQTDWRWPDLPRNNGFYCESDFANASQLSALMDQNKDSCATDKAVQRSRWRRLRITSRISNSSSISNGRHFN